MASSGGPPQPNPAEEAPNNEAPRNSTSNGPEESGTPERSGPWLNAWYDPVAGMSAFSQFLCLADLHADGEHRLIMVDLKKRIRIYRGTTIQWEQKLLDVPVAVQCFYHEVASPPIPTLAVASGHQVFIYRYMRPYLKFALPPVEIAAEEQEIWDEVKGCNLTAGCIRQAQHCSR